MRYSRLAKHPQNRYYSHKGSYGEGRKMSQLRKYTCAKCGAALIVDKEQEVYDCPFCDTKFDFDHFHGQDVLGEAGKALHRMEFTAAKEKYEMILKRNPHNFTALRGLVFCAGRITAPQYIQRIEKLRKCNIPKMRETIPFAIENALEEDKEYFVRLSSMLDLYDEFSDLDKEISKLNTQKNREMSKITNLEDHKDSFDNPFSWTDESYSDENSAVQDANKQRERSYLLVFLVILLFFLAGLFVYLFGPLGILIVVGAVLLFFGIRVILYFMIEKKKDPHREALQEIRGDMSGDLKRVQELSQKYEESYFELKKLDPSARESSSEDTSENE